MNATARIAAPLLLAVTLLGARHRWGEDEGLH